MAEDIAAEDFDTEIEIDEVPFVEFDISVAGDGPKVLISDSKI